LAVAAFVTTACVTTAVVTAADEYMFVKTLGNNQRVEKAQPTCFYLCKLPRGALQAPDSGREEHWPAPPRSADSLHAYPYCAIDRHLTKQACTQNTKTAGRSAQAASSHRLACSCAERTAKSTIAQSQRHGRRARQTCTLPSSRQLSKFCCAVVLCLRA